MAFSHSPKIVTNGLVLALDAGNVKSYPGTGTTWFDKSGNNSNGALTNGPTFNTGSLGSIVFDGVDDYVNLGTFTGLGSSNRTIEIWFQILSLSPSGNRRIFTLAADDSSTDNPACTIGYTTSTNSLSFGFGGSPYDGYVLNINFSLNTWMCLTGVITSNSISVYQNSTLINTVTNTGPVGSNPLGFISRYNAHYGQYSNSRVSNVKIYNRSLSSTEVLQNYNATKGRFGL